MTQQADNSDAASPRRAALRIALIYAIFGALWILLSDMVLSMFVDNPQRLTNLQTIKGWVFILVTAILVYYLSRSYARAVQTSVAELQQTERSYRRIVETANEGICTVDTGGNLLLVNARLAEMVGYAPEELTGRSLLSLVNPESHDSLAERLKQPPAAQNQPCDVKLRSRLGQEVWTLCAASALYDESCTYVGSLLMLTDISDRKRLEAQLLQLQKMEAIGQLAGGIAHDFNNIVTAILGNVDLMRLQLKRKPVPVDSLSSDVEQIERAGERAMALTRQLLTFSRRQVTRPDVIDPKTLLVEMEKMLSRLIREDIQLSIDVDADVPAVRADAGQLEQVVVNLVVNARDAMPSGGRLGIRASKVELEPAYVAMHPESREGPHALISVSDTGHGMDAATLQRVFEPFFTTKPTGKGTGLGLATVYGIVKQFGGHVNAYSEPDVGTTFKVYLPAAEQAPSAQKKQNAASPISGGNETILVCEDNEQIRTLLCRVLSEKGYRVESTGDPQAALEVADEYQGPIHMLITDVIMAGMGGRELAEHLQAARPELRVLFVSGHTADVIAHHGMLEPGVNFLAKPFNSDVLLRRVREVLDAGKTREVDTQALKKL